MNDISYEVWNIETGNMIGDFVSEAEAWEYAKDCSEANPTLQYTVDRVSTSDHIDHLGMYVGGRKLEPDPR